MHVTNQRGTLDPRYQRPPFTDWEILTMTTLIGRVRREGCTCHVVFSWRDDEERKLRKSLSVLEEHDDRCALLRYELMTEVTGPMRSEPVYRREQ